MTRGTEFRGKQLKGGDRAVLMWSSANHDRAVFDAPEKIDFSRDNKRHMAFGVGQHRCQGSRIARMMFQELITAVRDRLPDYELNGSIELYEDAGEVPAVFRTSSGLHPGPRVNVD